MQRQALSTPTICHICEAGGAVADTRVQLSSCQTARQVHFCTDINHSQFNEFNG